MRSALVAVDRVPLPVSDTQRVVQARAVAASDERCYHHRGLDAEVAARDVMSDEQIATLAGCLNRHRVEYVLVGGAASQLHGAPVARTRDADIVPACDLANLDRLAACVT